MTSAQNGNSRYADILGSLRMFRSVPSAAVRDLEKKLVFTRHGTGSVLYRQGERASGILFVFEGRIKLWANTMDNKTALLKVAGPGEILGLAAVMAGKPHLTTAQVTMPSLTALLRAEQLASAIRKCPQLAEAAAEWVALEYKECAMDMLLLRVPCSSSQRLAAALVRLANGGMTASSGPATLTYTHSELGQLIGASRETVTRLMKRLERQGVITTKHSTIQINEPRTLIELARLS